jgi:hypothetical protein
LRVVAEPVHSRSAGIGGGRANASLIRMGIQRPDAVPQNLALAVQLGLRLAPQGIRYANNCRRKTSVSDSH